MITEEEIINLKEEIRKLNDRIEFLEIKRLTQDSYLPDSIKQRHVGEGVRFIRGGITADKPTEGEVPMQGIAAYYDVTTKKLYLWNTTNSEWDEVQLA